MNTTSPTPSVNPVYRFDASGIFLIGGLCFMIFTFIMVSKILCLHPKRQVEPQIATPVLIEIPIAISISIQTVDNEHIGTVI